MRAGGQKVRVEIWTRSQTGTTPYNEPIFKDALWKTTWAQMKARRGSEHYEAGQVFSLTHFFFTFRFFSVQGIDTAHWLVFNGQRYDIRNVMPDYEDKDSIVVEARVHDIDS